MRPTCCHKNCPLCGGRECHKFVDATGKKLGAGKCCGMKIMNKGKVCGFGESKAPCKLQFTDENVLDYFFVNNKL